MGEYRVNIQGRENWGKILVVGCAIGEHILGVGCVGVG